MDNVNFCSIVVLVCVSYSRQDEILCSKDTYTWTEAMRQCLTLGGTPVGKDMNLDQIRLKQNVTIWVGNYLEYGRYVSQGDFKSGTQNMKCGHKSLDTNFNTGPTIYGPCDEEMIFAFFYTDQVVRFSKDVWTVAMSRKLSFALSKTQLQYLKAPAGKYWIDEFVREHRINTNASELPVSPDQCCGYSTTDLLTYAGSCETEERYVLCKFDSAPEESNFTKNCLVDESDDPEKEKTYTEAPVLRSSSVNVGTVVGVIAGILLLLAIIFGLIYKRGLLQEKLRSTVRKDISSQHNASPSRDHVNDDLGPVEYATICRNNRGNKPSENAEVSAQHVQAVPEVVDSSNGPSRYDDPVLLGQGRRPNHSNRYDVTTTGQDPKTCLAEGKPDNTGTRLAYDYTSQTHAQDDKADLTVTEDNENRYYQNIGSQNGVDLSAETEKNQKQVVKMEKPKRNKTLSVQTTENEYNSTISRPKRGCTGNVYNSLMASDDNYNVSTVKSKPNWQDVNYHQTIKEFP